MKFHYTLWAYLLLGLYLSQYAIGKRSDRRLRGGNPHFIETGDQPQPVDVLGNTTRESHFIHFMGRNISKTNWKSINMYIDNLLTYGNWVDAWTVENYRPMYDRFCFWEHPFLVKYVFYDCAVSLGMLGFKYLWQPSVKKLSLFSPESMCQVMNGRNIMLAGDSMQEELFYIFVSAMLAHVRIPHAQAMDTSYIEKKRTESIHVCETFCPYGVERCEGPVKVDCGLLPSFSISFYRTDHLQATEKQKPSATATSTSSTTNSHTQPLHSGSVATWIKRIGEYNISVLLLNTGAHFIDPSKSVDHVSTSLRYIYTHYPEISILYRSTPMGHPNCEQFFTAAPLDNADSVWIENMTISNVYAFGHLDYHWHQFQTQNDLMQSMLQREFPQVLWLNAHSSIHLRPDSHTLYKKDCLHYCSASGIDEWITFVLNALMIVEEQTSSQEEKKQEQEQQLQRKGLVGDTIILDDEMSRAAYWRNESAQQVTRPPHVLNTSYTHSDRHANAYFSSLHTSLITFVSEYTRLDSQRIMIGHYNKQYVLVNGTRRFVRDAWTQSIYRDDLHSPLIPKLNGWEVVRIPLRQPIVPQGDRFVMSDIPQ